MFSYAMINSCCICWTNSRFHFTQTKHFLVCFWQGEQVQRGAGEFRETQTKHFLVCFWQGEQVQRGAGEFRETQTKHFLVCFWQGEQVRGVDDRGGRSLLAALPEGG